MNDKWEFLFREDGYWFIAITYSLPIWMIFSIYKPYTVKICSRESLIDLICNSCGIHLTRAYTWNHLNFTWIENYMNLKIKMFLEILYFYIYWFSCMSSFDEKYVWTSREIHKNLNPPEIDVVEIAMCTLL